MSAENGFERRKIKELIIAHASGPSPTCDERPIANAEEWGLLKTTAVTWSGWNPNAHKVPPREYWGNKRLEIYEGDVLVTKAGPRDRCGVVVYVDRTPPRLMVSGKMIGLRPDPEKVNYKVLAAALSQHGPQRFLDSRTTGMADAQLNFTNDLLLNTEVSLPPKAEQSKIAEILSTVDRAIEQTEALIAKQQRIKTGLMQDLLTRGIDEQGNLRSEETHQFNDSPLGRIPAEWDVKTVGTVISGIDAGWSPSCPDDTPVEGEWGVLKVSAVSSGVYEPSESKRLPPELAPVESIEVKVGDVLMTRSNGVADLVGKCVLVERTPKQLMLSDKTLRLCPSAKQITPFVLFAALSSHTSRLQILASLNGSSGQKNISQTQIRSIRLRVPLVDEQERIERVLQAQITRISRSVTHLRKLRSLKTALMQDLLTGEKRVTPLLEPAVTT